MLMSALLQNKRQLLNFAKRRGFSHEDAEDCVQTVAMIALERAASFDPNLSNPGAWIYGIMRNVMRNLVRARRDGVSPLEDIPEMYLPSAEPDQDTVVELNEVRRVMEKMPPHRSKCLMLMSIGHSLQDIAEMMEVNRQYVQNHTFLARKQLRAKMGYEQDNQ